MRMSRAVIRPKRSESHSKTMLKPLKKAITGPRDQRLAFRMVGCDMRFEQKRAKCRAQGQGHCAGNDGGRSDGHGELTEELTGNAGDEGRWNEHGAKGQGDRDQRAADLVHGAMRGFARGHAEAQIALDVFHDDDGVVDHDADGKHKAEERQIVQRKTERREDREGADQRDRDGDDRNDGGAPGLQKQNHDEDHERDGFEDRRHDLVDRLRDEDRRIVDDVNISARPEIAATCSPCWL